VRWINRLPCKEALWISCGELLKSKPGMGSPFFPYQERSWKLLPVKCFFHTARQKDFALRGKSMTAVVKARNTSTTTTVPVAAGHSSRVIFRIRNAIFATGEYSDNHLSDFD
jgi:hypothetical protein